MSIDSKLEEERQNCTGCGACIEICPKRCIEMIQDENGFRYPVINKDLCIKCNKCIGVCQYKKRELVGMTVKRAYAAYTKDVTVRMNSSSGGIFFELAKYTIEAGGSVFGVRLSKDCRHAYYDECKSIDDLRFFMGSKYVQADASRVLKKVADCLKSGRIVLFTGTPCLVNELIRLLDALNVDYSKLFCVDIICHGVPSPVLWERYCIELERKCRTVLSRVSFRDKTKGWRIFGLKAENTDRIVYYKDLSEDAYIKLFLDNYGLRPSCYRCISKSIRKADITLGDLWGVESIVPEFDDNRGVSAIIVRTEKGEDLLHNIRNGIVIKEIMYELITKYNSAEHLPVKEPYNNETFNMCINKYSVSRLSHKFSRDGWARKAKRYIRFMVNYFKEQCKKF